MPLSSRLGRLPARLLLAVLSLAVFSSPFGASAAAPAGNTPGTTTAQTVQSTGRVAAISRPYKVAIQVGHYKNNELPSELSRLDGSTGTYGGGRSEVSLNLDVATRVVALLKAQGMTVEMLPATVPTGYTADVFVAIHADGNASSSPRGFKISTRWRSQVPMQDVRLVELLTGAYRSATGLPEDSNVTRNMRGYYAYATWRPNYRVSNFTPGAIVEMGYMTNAADRAVMFNAPGKVASGIAQGIVDFLREAYGSPRADKPFGVGMIDSYINPNAPAFPSPSPSTRQSSQRLVTGDWQLVLMGAPTIPVYSAAGGGQVVTRLPRDQFYHSTARKGDYYRLTLQDGSQMWVHRNAAVVKME